MLALKLTDVHATATNGASEETKGCRVFDGEPIYDFDTIKTFLRSGDRVLFYKPHQSFGFTIDTDENLASVHDLLGRDLGLRPEDFVETFCNGDGSQIIARIEHTAKVKPASQYGNALISVLTPDDGKASSKLLVGLQDSHTDVAGTPSATPVAMSLMITQRQRVLLRDRGFSAEEIRSMTPLQAHSHLGLVQD
ncbi:hypothetical protein [Methylobacterium oxalidis]|uniref:hypothetical protein n=1 Tax=Methylobacterium oxalidis TaxID=944322 RepID=UPI003315A30B